MLGSQNIAMATASLPNHGLLDAIATTLRLEFAGVCVFGASGARHSGGLLAGFFWDELDAPMRDSIRAALREFGDDAVHAIHAPFTDLPLVSLNPYVEREAMRQVLLSIEAAAVLGLRIVTVHANRPVQMKTPELVERTCEKLHALGVAAAKVGVRIGLENVQYPCDPDEYVTLLDNTAHPAVGATLDIGHIIMWLRRDGITRLEGEAGAALYNERLWQMIDALGQRIIHIHAHDVRPEDIRDHRAAGRGIIDFPALVSRLNSLNYAGMLEFELEEPDLEQAASDSRAYLLRAMS